MSPSGLPVWFCETRHPPPPPPELTAGLAAGSGTFVLTAITDVGGLLTAGSTAVISFEYPLSFKLVS
ncbi:MAG: hypothetical protein AABY87_11380 [bacterium]